VQRTINTLAAKLFQPKNQQCAQVFAWE